MDQPNVTPETTQFVLEFVRGLRGLRELAAVGITVGLAEQGCEVHNPAGLVVAVTPRDVAQGFVRLSPNPDALKEWASALLAGAAFLDLKLESDPYGQALLEGLWDASDDGRARPGALLAAREVFTQ